MFAVALVFICLQDNFEREFCRALIDWGEALKIASVPFRYIFPLKGCIFERQRQLERKRPRADRF